MVEEAEEGHGGNGETIEKTGLARLWRSARQLQETGRAVEYRCIVPWSLTFSNEDVNRRRSLIRISDITNF